MTPSEFIDRAKRAGCRVDVSGSVYFVSNGVITIKIDAANHYHIRHVTGQDMNYKLTTASAASRALKLPRR